MQSIHSAQKKSPPAPPLNLALVTETWLPEINGVAMTLARLAGGVQERGWRVSLVRPRQRNESEWPEGGFAQLLVPGLPIPGYAGLRFGLPMIGTLRSNWSRHRPDVVHIATEGPLGWAALQVARSLKIPVTSTFHTNFHRYCKHYRIGWLRGVVTRHLRQFHNRSSFTMVPNDVLRHDLQQDGYRNVVVLGRGVDTSLFSPSRRSAALRAQWGIPEHGLAVIYVGRLAPEKNLRTVESSFAEIEQRDPRARMVWVGDGPELDRLKKTHPHHVFAGPKLGGELAEHYASADLFLFPSQTETYGNVVPEAMASGLAVVAFDYAAAALYVDDQHNGVLATFGDQQEFIRKSVALAAEPQQISQIKLAAPDAVTPHTWDAVCGHFDTYLRMAAQQAG